MNWAIWIPIIAQNGLEVAAKLHSLYMNNTPPTEADWQSLIDLSKQTATDKMRQAITATGISDPQRIADLIALTVPKV